ncbi:hypothetical protein C8J56DRAFT_1002071 [Mycena floridula]|nr:hypothetical protein C8J56DRAFT_1002071 [Mycena floridula]
MSETNSVQSDQLSLRPFSAQFTDKHLKASRKIYFQTLCGGSFALSLCIFSIFSIYWGALWKTPAHNMLGYVVDFDGSTIGSVVSSSLAASSAIVAWTVLPASSFPSGPSQVTDEILKEKAWIAVVINANATSKYNAAVAASDGSYDGSAAITVYATEARNENAFRSLLRPIVQSALAQITAGLALQFSKQLSSSASLGQLLSTAPQLIIAPVGFTINNLRPFDIPVASAVTFVGLIYLLILSFFIVMIGVSAREISGLERQLTTASLIRVRLASTFIAYFFISLFYSLLSLAFQVDFSRSFGHAGFVVFWMLNFVGMMAVGLALEAMITLLTAKFVPFFMIIWIIVNVSVCFLPLEVLPKLYHYGYAMPFYNVSKAVRTILFGTENNLGLNFGVLLCWSLISFITLPAFQWFVRRRHIRELNGFVKEKETEAYTREQEPRTVS